MLKKSPIILSLLIVLVLILAACSGGASTTTTSSSATAAAVSTPTAISGAQLYQQNCASCHGANGAGGLKIGGVTSPDIRGPALASTFNNDISLIKRAILDGKDEKGADLDTAMPRFRGSLSDDQLNAIISYLQTLK